MSCPFINLLFLALFGQNHQIRVGKPALTYQQNDPKNHLKPATSMAGTYFEKCGYLLFENDLSVSFSINFGKTFSWQKQLAIWQTIN
jgi:hypothetical protein